MGIRSVKNNNVETNSIRTDQLISNNRYEVSIIFNLIMKKKTTRHLNIPMRTQRNATQHNTTQQHSFDVIFVFFLNIKLSLVKSNDSIESQSHGMMCVIQMRAELNWKLWAFEHIQHGMHTLN